MDKILIVAGYGGHAGYAYAVAYHIHKLKVIDKQWIDIIVPEGYGWVRRKLEDMGNIIEHPLPRRPNEPLHKTIPRWLKSFQKSWKDCKEYPVILATGSNFSLPMSITCKIKKKSKLYVIEAVDRIITASKTPKILYKIGGKILLSWREQLRNYPKGIIVGPIYEPRIYRVRDEDYILVTTGTLGLPDLYKVIAKLGYDNVVVQSGDIPPRKVSILNRKWRVFSYTPDIHKWIAGAKLVITQYPGMTAVTARLAYRKPVVLVQSTRHKLSSQPFEGPILAKKLRVPYVNEPNKIKIEKAIKKAIKDTPPSYPNGAENIAKLLDREYKQIHTTTL